MNNVIQNFGILKKNIIKNDYFYIFILVLFIIFLLYFYFFNNTYYQKKQFENKDDKTIEIVVARYNEDLTWLNNSPFSKYPVVCYNKGLNENIEVNNIKKIVKLPNVGRESHSYLYHIINNYNNLSDITIFLPGSTNSSDSKKTNSNKLLKEVENNNKSVIIGEKYNNVKNDLYNFQLKNWKSTNIENHNLNPEHKLTLSKIRPFGKWYENRFKNIDIQYVCYGGIFAIAKMDILKHPVTYYENLIDELSYSSNPEVGHYFERSWNAIFHHLTDAIFMNSIIS